MLLDTKSELSLLLKKNTWYSCGDACSASLMEELPSGGMSSGSVEMRSPRRTNRLIGEVTSMLGRDDDAPDSMDCDGVRLRIVAAAAVAVAGVFAL